MPYEEIPHTADWSLRVRADTLSELFSEAAKGMFALTGIRLADTPRIERNLILSAADAESLLVTFLSELLFLSEEEKLGFDEIQVQTDGHRLEAKLGGARILSLEKAIKAVTFHNLQIQKGAEGYKVDIVFDV